MSTETTKKIFLSLGESKNLYSEITPNAVSASKVSWSTTNSSVATVTGSLNKYVNQSIGTVQAIAHGKATIKASVPKYISGVHLTVDEVTDSCEVVVPRPKVSIEVGHGKYGVRTDEGATFVYNSVTIKECDIALVVSMELKRQLEKHGVEVLISRETLEKNYEWAKDFFEGAGANFKPDVGISVHVNAFDGTPQGFEVYRQTSGAYQQNSQNLCSAIAVEVSNIGQVLRDPNPPYSRTGQNEFTVLMNAFPATYAYCEMGFLDNPIDYARFNTIEKQKNFGTAYAKGILKYLGIAWKP